MTPTYMEMLCPQCREIVAKAGLELREVTDADVEIARLKFVVSCYEELIRKWAEDVRRLREEART